MSMQTEAAPKEPFTIGVLFRYKFTVFVVALLAILGGYARIVTQPVQYEATARLAVRFTSEALELSSAGQGSLYRLPLLEEEVKAYMVQINDPQFIDKVVDSLNQDDSIQEAAGGTGGSAPEIAEETVLSRFKDQFLKAFYDVRREVLHAVDTILLTNEAMLSPREQRVMEIVSRLTITAGTEASHIITVSYRDKDAALATRTVNKLARQFISTQKARVKKKDEAKYLTAIDEATQRLVDNKKGLFELTRKLESPTIEEAIKKKYDQLLALQRERDSFQVAKHLLDQGIIPEDRSLPLETHVLSGELEQEWFNIHMRYEEQFARQSESPQLYQTLIKAASKHIEERRAAALKRDMVVVDAKLKDLNEKIEKLLGNPTLDNLSPDYARLFTQMSLEQGRIAKAEADLAEVKDFNERLENENVSENIALWQQAQIPPFPLPQHRALKLLVVMFLGLFAGGGAALLRHSLRPRPLRRVRPQLAGEVEIPLIILPDDGKGSVERDLELDISFPEDDSSLARGGRA